VYGYVNVCPLHIELGFVSSLSLNNCEDQSSLRELCFSELGACWSRYRAEISRVLQPFMSIQLENVFS